MAEGRCRFSASELRHLPAGVALQTKLLVRNVIALAVSSAILLAPCAWLASPASGAEPEWPSTHWAESDDPTALGWSMEKLKGAEEYTQAYAPTAVMIVQDGKIVAS
jgi:hypothetical protein